MVSKVFNSCAKIICEEHLPDLLRRNNGEITVIGIDGPTAAGKTILADTIVECLAEECNRKCWVYRLDWNLVQRGIRVSDLKNLSNHGGTFELEGELHMSLDILRGFLEKVNNFNERMCLDDSMSYFEEIQLNNLYSRTDNGEMTGQHTCKLEKELVILVEGHYTLRSELDDFIDLNILILSEMEELLARKVARVQDYRGEKAATDYFWHIDLPSFRHHLERFGENADFIVDNNNFQKPVIKKRSFYNQWLENNVSDEVISPLPKENLKMSEVITTVFSASMMVSSELKAQLKSVIELMIQWDLNVSQYMRNSIDNIEKDLSSLTEDLIVNLNKNHCKTGNKFIIRHTNALHNAYVRVLPITIGVEICDDFNVKILADIFSDHLRIQITWKGGYYSFRIAREFGKISTSVDYEIHNTTKVGGKSAEARKIVRVITPTSFTIPKFLSEIETDVIYSGHEDENISAAEAVNRFAEMGGVWIHRFAKFSELHFFFDIIENIGGKVLEAGNYLIAVWSENEQLTRQAKAFFDGWHKRTASYNKTREDEDRLDAIIDSERKQLKSFVVENCPDFIVLDGYIHCVALVQGSKIRSGIVEQIAKMLRSDFRIIRKRGTQFIQKHFPDLTLPASGLWKKIPQGAQKRIFLDVFTSMSPSILAEIFLWLALRDDSSAVVGANIYDIRKNSIDCRAMLEAATSKNTPIILQGSLNALGQSEDNNGEVVRGYLNTKNGANDLVEAALTAVRDMVLVDGFEPPLFGIGLDHVDVAYDRPTGRAARFLQAALSSENVTHYVLDGSALFNARTRSVDDLKSCYERIINFAVSLLDGKEELYIYDMEVCVGELNYISSTEKVMIPTASEMQLFTNMFIDKMRQVGLGAFNTRPSLFVGNLGTTHHAFDTDEISTMMSRKWRDKLKSDNFVSAVLHGTTNTHPHILSEATVGCHKINIAGDFLHTLINGLPSGLIKVVEGGGVEPKKMIPKIRKQMDSMSAAEVNRLKDSIKAHCMSILDNINSPKLSSLDMSYFRYKNFKFTDLQVETICDELNKNVLEYEVSEQGLSDNRLGYEFSASMIEVPFGDEYKKLTEMLWNEGIRHFHIDVGDGKFIDRTFSGLDKAKYLKEKYPESILHCHLMVENPQFSNNESLSPIEQYINAGCEAIAIHRNSFTKQKYLLSGLELIKNCGARPGLIIEITETFDGKLQDLIVEYDLDWVVIMGVAVGYGGQIFNMSSLNTVTSFTQYAKKTDKPFLIEIDGGLTMENIQICKHKGAQILSGWSLIKGNTIEETRDKVRTVRKLLS